MLPSPQVTGRGGKPLQGVDRAGDVLGDRPGGVHDLPPPGGGAFACGATRAYPDAQEASGKERTHKKRRHDAHEGGEPRAKKGRD